MTALRDAHTAAERVPGSFRDPSGFLFARDGQLFRQVNRSYSDHYDHLMRSGLYDALRTEGLLVAHEEVAAAPASDVDAWRVLRPEPVPFVSYPYEWCFSQLKDAALATLAIQKLALAHGMSLKDASAYNIQFRLARPLLVDTLSFERYPEGRPWVAYRQFCQHFLAPLALMAYTDVRLNSLFRVHLDGVPLDLTRALLPGRTRFRFSLLSHIHLHAASQRHYADKQPDTGGRRLSRFAMLALVDSLEAAVRRLRWRPEGTEWADYYDQTNYGPASFGHKQRIVGEFLDRLQPATVWDLGANTGPFSRIAAGKGMRTVAFDSDPAAVEKLYQAVTESGEACVLPLLQDLTNPSTAVGWDGRERLSLEQRGPADALLALGLVHHLGISNNVPLDRVAECFARLGRTLVVEFVPKEDSQAARLLATREDIFPTYREDAFRDAFGRYFHVEGHQPIPGSARTLYAMRRR